MGEALAKHHRGDWIRPSIVVRRGRSCFAGLPGWRPPPQVCDRTRRGTKPPVQKLSTTRDGDPLRSWGFTLLSRWRWAYPHSAVKFPLFHSLIPHVRRRRHSA